MKSQLFDTLIDGHDSSSLDAVQRSRTLICADVAAGPKQIHVSTVIGNLLLEWRFVADVGTGRAVSISTFSDEAAFVASRSEIDSILSELGRFLVEKPTEILGTVVVSV